MKWKEKSEFHHLVKELEEHPNHYEMYFRMTKEEFNFLHDLIRGNIQTENMQFQEATSMKEKLAVCASYKANYREILLFYNNILKKSRLTGKLNKNSY
jgi:hypothetical protein